MTQGRETPLRPREPAELVSRLQLRDPAAFRELYESLAAPLTSFAYGLVRDRGAAEDVVQQAFLELTAAIPEMEGGEESVRAWMYRCVRFRCLDEIRRRRRHPETLVEDLHEGEAVAFPDPVDDMVDPALVQALESLTEQQRTVVLLRHVVGLSGAETARVMGTNRAAVYALSARGEAALRRALAAVESVRAPASEPMRERQGEPEPTLKGRQAPS